MKWTTLLCASTLLLGFTFPNLSADNSKPEIFSFDSLSSEAKELSKTPYKECVSNLPKTIRELDYNQYNMLRFKIENDLWAKDNLPFTISFFPPGSPLYSLPVEIFEVNYNEEAHRVPFSKDFFDYSKEVDFVKNEMPENAGYPGFKIRYHPEEEGSYPNEFAVFLGSSYFRIVSDGSSYGLSNRGIAINTGLEGVSEEFPAFEKFYIQKPQKGDASIVIYALLNGQSLTGAYQMKITPGSKAAVDVQSVIYLREESKLMGIAPITSMFWFTLGTPSIFRDYRPSVHNSEGVLIKKTDSTIYAPLVNYPAHKMINYDFDSENIESFGLIQRNREYNRYMDPNVRYQLNPNCMVTPSENLGKGKLRLFVLPTLSEWNDNVNLFWIPDKAAVVNQPIPFNYRLDYSISEEQVVVPFVKYTNLGQDLADAANTIFALSFEDVDKQIEDNKDLKVDLSVPDGVSVVSPPSIEYISFNNTWRVIFTLKSESKPAWGDKPFPINCVLKVNNKPISENWHFLWYPF